MTRDDIIKMAREASFIWDEMGLLDRLAFYKFADLVAAAEREACAKVCESQMPNPVKNWADAQIVNALRDCASTIRAKGNP